MTLEADIAAAVRTLPMPDYRPGQGFQARKEAIAAEAARVGLPPERVAEIWRHGFDCDQVLAEVRRLQAEHDFPGGPADRPLREERRSNPLV